MTKHILVNMPTIIINTNLSTKNNYESNPSEDSQDDYKEEINSIITKLLTKSQKMESFFIKYDVNDILKNEEIKPESLSNCVCKRLGNIFSDLLRKPKLCDDESSPKNTTKTIEENEIKNIHSELNIIRSSQINVLSKLDSVINKLNSLDEPTKSMNTNNIPMERSSPYQHSKQREMNHTRNFIGAKKRKCSNFYKKNDLSIDQNDNNIYDDAEVHIKIETDEENIQSMFDNDREKNESENQSENMDEDYENQLSRDCHSHASSGTSDSKVYMKNSNETNKDTNGKILENIESQDETLEQSTRNIHERHHLLIEPDKNREKLFMNNLDDTSTTENDIDDLDTENGNCSQEFADLNENRFRTNFNRSNIIQRHNQQESKSSAFRYMTQSNNNNFQSNGYQKISGQQHHSFVPNQKFRLINQLPSRQLHHTQNIPNTMVMHKERESKVPIHNRSFSNYVHNFQGQMNTNQAIITPCSNNDMDNSKLKSNMNLSKQNGDVNADVTTEIDLNELFKSGNAPRFLQFELYKDFKPPVFTICDKLYIESPLASSAYSKSKSRRNFAAHLAKLVFTPRERLESNCNGRFGKKALDTLLLNSIKNTLFQFYPCRQSTNDDSIASGGCDENNVWLRDCIPAIDESNRVLKKQLIAWYKKTHMIQSNGSTFSMNSSSKNHKNVPSTNDFDYSNYQNDEENNLEDVFDI